MKQLDRKLGLERSHAGAQLALFNAGEEWKKFALNNCWHWCIEHSEPFQMDQVRVQSEVRGLELPPDRRAWGAIARMMVKVGYAEKIGYRAQAAITCHGSPKALYRSLISK